MKNSVPWYVRPRKGKPKVILGTGRGGPYGCVTSRLAHYVDDRLIDGGDASLALRPTIGHESRKIP
jgi:hypothetical protein